MIAIDQPRVVFGLLEPGTSTLVGPIDYNYAALDTGSNGILLSSLAFLSGETYTQALNAANQPVYYTETGISGPTDLAVLVPYDLVYEGTDTNNEFTLPSIRALASSELDLGSFSGVVGMPAMTGRIVSLDFAPVAQLDLIGVAFPAAPTATTPDSYHINLSMLPVDFSGQQAPGDPLPTYSPLPLLGTRAAFNSASWSGTMLLDTGAQNSFISQAAADALGIDYTHSINEGGDVIDVLPVGGVGGSENVPLVQLSSLAVPTVEGVDLIWSDVTVGVIDLPGVDGVFGMNMLMSGYGAGVLSGVDLGDLLGSAHVLQALIDYGLIDGLDSLTQLLSLLELLSTGSIQPYIRSMEFDFTSPSAGVMRLDLYPEVNQVLPEPSTALALLLMLPLFTRRR